MNIKEYLTLPLEHEISALEAQQLNISLSQASVNDIPPKHRSMIRDYLILALNMDSVEVKIKPQLEKLLDDI